MRPKLPATTADDRKPLTKAALLAPAALKFEPPQPLHTPVKLGAQHDLSRRKLCAVLQLSTSEEEDMDVFLAFLFVHGVLATFAVRKIARKKNPTVRRPLQVLFAILVPIIGPTITLFVLGSDHVHTAEAEREVSSSKDSPVKKHG